jgi:hypothetical protein
MKNFKVAVTSNEIFIKFSSDDTEEIKKMVHLLQDTLLFGAELETVPVKPMTPVEEEIPKMAVDVELPEKVESESVAETEDFGMNPPEIQDEEPPWVMDEDSSPEEKFHSTYVMAKSTGDQELMSELEILEEEMGLKKTKDKNLKVNLIRLFKNDIAWDPVSRAYLKDDLNSLFPNKIDYIFKDLLKKIK